MYLPLIYLLLINIITFFVYRYDYSQAKHRKARIPEIILLLLAIFGGAIVGYFYMTATRYKASHVSFKVIMPIFALLWVGIIIVVMASSFNPADLPVYDDKLDSMN